MEHAEAAISVSVESIIVAQDTLRAYKWCWEKLKCVCMCVQTPFPRDIVSVPQASVLQRVLQSS